MANTMYSAWPVLSKFMVCARQIIRAIANRHCSVEKPATLTVEAVRRSLMRIVPLCLDSDPSLIPISCRTSDMQSSAADDDRDPDDFNFWSERQARRISNVIKQTFDVEYAPEVIVADANLTALANRILVSKEILSD